MKRLILSSLIAGFVFGIINSVNAVPPPPVPPRAPLPPYWRYPPPPVWRPYLPPPLPRPWVVVPPRPWYGPRPPLPWYWAPPPPAIRHWWFWVWWKPMPVNIVLYPAPHTVYYYPAPYPEPVYPYPPTYRDEMQNVYPEYLPSIDSVEEYEQWLIQKLNLTPEQQKDFLPKLHALVELRDQYVSTRTALNAEIKKLKKSGDISAAEAKSKELKTAESKFRKQEQKLIDELLSLLTEEQKTKFINEMKQYEERDSEE
ncbi:MAG: hypothetical protein N3A72_02965 [bacterium]|nr:hypothetical protein [bacterium]